MTQLLTRLTDRLERADHTITGTVILLSIGSAGVGLSMLWVPGAYRVNSFKVALDWFPPHVWGGALLAIALCTLVALRGDRQTIAGTVAGQGTVWALWGLALVIGVRDGVPSGAIIYTAISWICLVLAAHYWLSRKAHP